VTRRRLVVTVCPREPGVVTLPVAFGEPAVKLNAAAITHHLRQLVAERGLTERVRVREGCAGGCSGPGPNVSVEILPLTRPGEREDHVAIGWKTYVYSLGSLDYLAAVIDDNIGRTRVRASRSA
jgi:hypothetical protein